MPPLNTFEKTIIALAFANSVVVPTTHAATITVAGACTLQNAIHSANNDAATGGCDAGSGADIIDIMPAQTITLTAVDPDGYEYGASGLPVVTSQITIQGNGSTIERDALADDFRIIALAENTNSVSLTLDSITLTGGRAVDAGYGAGGAIFVGYDYGLSTGNLTLNNTTINDNFSDGDGGGIFLASGTIIEINNSSLTGNSAAYSGGGVYADQVSSLTISNTTIDANIADASGAGVWIDYAVNVNIFNSTLSNNNVLSGGDSGGAIAGYGIDNLVILNSTISTNSAPSNGSGLYLYASTMVMTNSTVANNLGNSTTYFSGTNSDGFVNSATFINSVIANSLSLDCVEGSYSVLNTDNSNWFEDASCDNDADGDPLLGGLSDNSGPTLTHQPQLGSGLIDNADPKQCPNADQRGELRDVNVVSDDIFFSIKTINGNVVVFNLGEEGIAGQCDIGSVEVPETS